MPHFCMSKLNWLRTDWFWHNTDALLRTFKPGDLAGINHHLDQFFDAQVRNPQPHANPVCVPINCPGHWPPPLDPVWYACSSFRGHQREEEAAKFLGGLYCRRAIARPEVWISSPLPFILPHKSRHYVLASDDFNWPGRKRPNGSTDK